MRVFDEAICFLAVFLMLACLFACADFGVSLLIGLVAYGVSVLIGLLIGLVECAGVIVWWEHGSLPPPVLCNSHLQQCAVAADWRPDPRDSAISHIPRTCLVMRSRRRPKLQMMTSQVSPCCH